MNQLPETNSVEDLQKQLAVARKEISNLRQQIVGLKHLHKKEIDLVCKKLENWKCQSCQEKRSDRAASSLEQFDFSCNYIGVISTEFPEKRATPRQPGICAESQGKLTLNNSVFTNPSHALQGLEEFSHLWILFHFNRNDSTHIRAKIAPPRLNGVRMGVFATRSPHRPSAIGMSLVKIVKIENNVLFFTGVDMTDQTPVLDIKPYIPHYDNPVLSTTFYPEESLYENLDSSRNLNRSDQIEGEENRRDEVVGASSVENINLERSRIGEREAPDGEEEDNSQSQGAAAAQPGNGVRVPDWIDKPPVHQLKVVFKDGALRQLNRLTQGEQKMETIVNVLREDPRSVYLRTTPVNHFYNFRISDLNISCKFDDINGIVTVYQVVTSDESFE